MIESECQYLGQLSDKKLYNDTLAFVRQVRLCYTGNMTDNAEFPLISKTGKRYRVDYSEDGDTLRVYESGAIYNETEGHLIGSPPDKRITSGNSADMNRLKTEKFADFRKNGVIEAVRANSDVIGDVDRFTAAQALAHVNAEKALSGEAGSVQAYKEAKKDLGILDQPASNGQIEAVKQHSAEVIAQIMKVALEKMQELEAANAPEVIDG